MFCCYFWVVSLFWAAQVHGISCSLSETAIDVFEHELDQMNQATSFVCACDTEPRIVYENHACLSPEDRLAPTSCIYQMGALSVQHALLYLNSLPTVDAVEWDSQLKTTFLILSQDVPRASKCSQSTHVFEKIRHQNNASDPHTNCHPSTSVCPTVDTSDTTAVGLSHRQREWISGSEKDQLVWPTSSICNGAAHAKNHCDAASKRCVCHDDFTGRNCAKRKTQHCCVQNSATSNRKCPFNSVAVRQATGLFRQSWCGSLNVPCTANATDLETNPTCDCSADTTLRRDGIPASIVVYTGSVCERSLCPPLPFATADPLSNLFVSQQTVDLHGQCNERPQPGQASGRCTVACISTEDGDQDFNPRCMPVREPVALTYYCKCTNIYPSFWLSETGCTVDIGPSNGGTNPNHDPDTLAACGVVHDTSYQSNWTPECNNRGYCSRSGVCKCFDTRLDASKQCSANLCGECPGEFGTCNVDTGECTCHPLFTTLASDTLPCRTNLCTRTGGSHDDSFTCECPDRTSFSALNGGCVFDTPIGADGVTLCGAPAAVVQGQKLTFNPSLDADEQAERFFRGCSCRRAGTTTNPFRQVRDPDTPGYGSCERVCSEDTNWNSDAGRCCEFNPNPSICQCPSGFRIDAKDPRYDPECKTPFCQNGGTWTGSECDCSTTVGDDPEFFGVYDGADSCAR